VTRLGYLLIVLLLAGCAATGPGGGLGKKESAKAASNVDPKIAAAYEQALSAMRGGNQARAESALKQFIKKYPSFSGPRANLGILYYRAKKTEQAKAEFRAALEINAKNVVSLNHLGIISREEGKFKEALAFYERALRIEPDYAYAHLNFGILLELYMGKLTEALGHYKRYQELTDAKDKEVAKWIVDLGRRAKKR